VRSRHERQRRRELEFRRDQIADRERGDAVDRLQLVMLGLEIAIAAKVILIDVLKREIRNER
jgi:hypothetical protein